MRFLLQFFFFFFESQFHFLDCFNFLEFQVLVFPIFVTFDTSFLLPLFLGEYKHIAQV